MSPEANLSQFVFGKELKLISRRAHKKGALWECEKLRHRGGEVCGRCASLSKTRFGVAHTTVRELGLRGEPLWLRIKKHRYFCHTCRKPFTETVQGILPRRRTTQRLRRQILQDCDDVTNLKRVARRHACSRSLVGQIFTEQMETKLRERIKAPWPRVLGIDEHRFKRGERGFPEFVTMLTDVGKRKVFELAETKNTASLVQSLAHIPGRERVEIVTLDLSRGYRSFVQTLFPQAKLVADKFHVLRLVTPDIIRERRIIHGHRQDLKYRRQLLRSREKMDYFERCDLDRYLKGHEKLRELYWAKEKLHRFYRTKGYDRARHVLEAMLVEFKNSRRDELRRLGRTLALWKEPILEYFRSRFTNAFTEAMNSIAKLVQRRGCGYRNFKSYRLRTLSSCPA